MEREELIAGEAEPRTAEPSAAKLADPPNPGGEAPGRGTAASAVMFPSEPFSCPACGQLLGPAVRVCVSCKQPIDPRQIQRGQAVAIPFETPLGPYWAERVQFPWRLFFIILVFRLLAAALAQTRWGLFRAELALGSVELLTGAWVLFDAHQKRLPKPLRWALGSLLLWIIVFPWYLARRRQPGATCPFVEAELGPVARVLLFALVIFLLLAMIFVVVKKAGG